MAGLKIGQLAKASGVRTDTVRYYEQLGLIYPEDHSEAGYRLYNKDSIRLVQFIRRAKDLGFKLGEVKTLLTLKASQTATCKDMLENTEKKLAEAKDTIRHLNKIHDALEELAKACPGGDMPLSECPILDYLYPKIFKQGG
ncbi:heavy metal-responsive transcriptional regulator [Paremcibacter congregatus]|uniref:heavy metal-responsive transcriptional regulator n=1 Tax=Paremcibacter congregatus TaxID=2043170 RepID=UPI0030EC962C|tara:strand:- start:1960 stop:2382 length:423 start_codon:yes stop_codon:yes gene_type:complete